ncbi:uncharacterized protein [Periplaneta americana]
MACMTIHHLLFISCVGRIFSASPQRNFVTMNKVHITTELTVSVLTDGSFLMYRSRDRSCSDTSRAKRDVIPRSSVTETSFESEVFHTKNSAKNDLMVLAENVETLRKEAEFALSVFTTHENQTLLQISINKTHQFADALSNYLNRLKMKNANQNGDSNEVSGKTRKLEKELDRIQNTVEVLNSLESIMNITVKLEHNKDKSCKDPAIYKDISHTKLRNIVTSCNVAIQLSNELLRELKIVWKYVSSRDFQFVLNSSSRLVDVEFWESMQRNQTESLQFYKNHLERATLSDYIAVVLFSIIFATGSLGNGVLLAVFARHKEFRTPPNLIVLSLTIADFVSLLMNILVYGLLQGLWNLDTGQILYTVYVFVRHTSLYAGVYTVVVISVQRCLVLMDFKKSGRRTWRNHHSVACILVVWIISTALAIDPTIYAATTYYPSEGEEEDFSRRFVLTDLFTSCVVPLVVIAVSSGVSARLLKRSIATMPGETIGVEEVKQARVLSSKILVALIVVFAICYVPYSTLDVVMFWFKPPMEEIIQDVLYTITYCLIFANCCFNPLAIYLTCKKYRTRMNTYLLCRRQDEAEQPKAISFIAKN